MTDKRVCVFTFVRTKLIGYTHFGIFKDYCIYTSADRPESIR